MQQKQSIIVADTSCLILLQKIKLLNVLEQIFTSITIPQIVADEFGQKLPNWIFIQNPTNTDFVNSLSQRLDMGEANAIALAKENKESLLIIDELKGRKVATSLDIETIGTLGILLQAKRAGYISSLNEILIKIQQTDFRISDRLMNDLLKIAEE